MWAAGVSLQFPDCSHRNNSILRPSPAFASGVDLLERPRPASDILFLAKISPMNRTYFPGFQTPFQKFSFGSLRSLSTSAVRHIERLNAVTVAIVPLQSLAKPPWFPLGSCTDASLPQSQKPPRPGVPISFVASPGPCTVTAVFFPSNRGKK